MMDDLTQEEIKIIMDLRKVEIDNKIKIDKEKLSVFMPLYLKKKQLIVLYKICLNLLCRTLVTTFI